MNVVRINSKNVIFILLAIFSTTVKQAHMGYESAIKYAQKEANVNSTPAYSSTKEEISRLCPSGIACSELSGDCLKCNLNSNCVYGAVYVANCSVLEHVDCIVRRRRFMKNLLCNWTVGYRWSTALILSITLGGFGADRFYLGHWQEGIGKLFSFGGLGVWTLIDVILISMRYLGPADGSLYI
ncbi:TM2 domain-containing protein almondex [Eufriesea mexicana]|nr:TM2 domain-containing protein almondex [Eufriesea mexicana]